MVNTAVVSRYLSQEAVALTGACSGCVSIVNTTLPAFVSGFGVRLSRCTGSGRREEIRQGFWGAFYLTLALGGLCLFAALFPENILRGANVPEILLPDAAAYFRVILLGAGILYPKPILISAIQGMGNSVLPSALSMVGVVVQTVLALVWFLGMLSGGRFSFFSPIRIKRVHYLDTLASGCSKGLMFMFLSTGSFFMQRMENCLLTDLLAGDAYSDQYTALFTELLSVYGTAAIVIVGQNAGCGNFALIREYVGRLYRRSLAVFLVIAALPLFGFIEMAINIAIALLIPRM